MSRVNEIDGKAAYCAFPSISRSLLCQEAAEGKPAGQAGWGRSDSHWEEIMKPRNLAVLLVALAIVAGLAWWTTTSRSRSTAPSSAAGQPLLPGLPVNDVRKIVFRGTDDAIVAAKVGDLWVAPGKYNYPVKFDRVRNFLRTVADLKIGQIVAAAGKDRERMKLIPPSGAGTGKVDKAGILVSFENGEGHAVASLLLGDLLKKSSPRGRRSSFGEDFDGESTGRYVEAGGRICLVADTLYYVPRKMADWLDDELLSIRSYELSNVEVSGAGRETVFLKHAQDGDKFTVDGLGADQEMDDSKVQSLTGSLGDLRFQDIADPALTDAQTGLDNPVVCIARTRENRVFKIKVGKTTGGNENGRYARVSVEYSPPEGTREPSTGAGSSNAVPAAALSNAPAVAASNTMPAAAGSNTAEEVSLKAKAEEEKTKDAEAKALNAKFRPWTYLIGERDANALLVAKKELVKKKEEKKSGETEDELPQPGKQEEKKP